MQPSPLLLQQTFLAFFFAALAVSLLLRALNLRRISANLGDPTRLQRLAETSLRPTTVEELATTLRYRREGARLGVISKLWGSFWLIALLASGALPAAESLTIGLTGRVWIDNLLLMTLPFLLLEILGWPFSFYSTFAIETRYGFNRQTLKGWLGDRAKGFVLSLALGLPLFWLVFTLITNEPQRWWLWAWIAVTVFQLLVAAIAPAIILPLFNKFTPLEPGSLKEGIEGLAQRAKFRLAGVFVMDGSKRSTHSNAFFIGFGPYKRIALFDTLIGQCEEKELLGVVAHELGHFRLGHIRWGMLRGILSLGFGMWLLGAISRWDALYAAAGLEPSVGALLLIVGLCGGAFTYWLGPISALISRRNEYAADRYSAEMMEDVQPMIDGLEKLQSENRSNPDPHPWLHAWGASHPTVRQRIAALGRMKPSVAKRGGAA